MNTRETKNLKSRPRLIENAPPLPFRERGKRLIIERAHRPPIVVITHPTLECHAGTRLLIKQRALQVQRLQRKSGEAETHGEILARRSQLSRHQMRLGPAFLAPWSAG